MSSINDIGYARVWQHEEYLDKESGEFVPTELAKDCKKYIKMWEKEESINKKISFDREMIKLRFKLECSKSLIDIQDRMFKARCLCGSGEV